MYAASKRLGGRFKYQAKAFDNLLSISIAIGVGSSNDLKESGSFKGSVIKVSFLFFDIKFHSIILLVDLVIFKYRMS